MARDVAPNRFVDPGHHAQKRRLARPVVADDADPVAVLEAEAYVVQGSHRETVAGVPTDASTGSVVDELVLDGTHVSVVDREIDRDRLHVDARVGVHTQ